MEKTKPAMMKASRKAPDRKKHQNAKEALFAMLKV